MPPKKATAARASNAQASTSGASNQDMFNADGLTIRVEEDPSTKQHFTRENMNLDRSLTFPFFTKTMRAKKMERLAVPSLHRWGIADGARVSAKTQKYWDDHGGYAKDNRLDPIFGWADLSTIEKPPAWYATLAHRDFHPTNPFSVYPPREQIYLDDDDTANTQAKEAIRAVKLRGQTLAAKLFAGDNNANMPIGRTLSILGYVSTAWLAMHTDTACRSSHFLYKPSRTVKANVLL